jgi:hypothetical protein
MPKFKRLPKSEKPFKFELEEDFTITPRFDREFWEGETFQLGSLTKVGYMLLGNPCSRFFNVDVESGLILFKEKGRNNGLTCHRDHSWAINSGAPHAHDILLGEGYGETWFDKEERAIIDRVFLSVLLDHVDTLSGFKKGLYKFYAYSMYYAVRANSIVGGWLK